MREAVDPPTIHPPLGYSHAVIASGGTTVYLAGQVAWDRDGQLVGEGDFEAQARQVFHNLFESLRSVGAEPADLVRIGVYVVDHDNHKLQTLRRVRDEFFGDTSPPASTLLGVAALAVPGLMIEIDGIALLDGRGRTDSG